MPPSSRIMFGSALFAPGQGGIACVARMTARALIESDAAVDLISFLDREPTEVAGVRAKIARGDKLRFALMTHFRALRATHAIYDSVGIARAHPRLFGDKIPRALWMMGLESWEGMRGDYLATVRSANLVVAISRYTLERHQAAHGQLPQARICWLATEQDAPPATLARFEGPPRVLIVGRIEATEGLKGHDELIACWPKVVAEIPAARLVIAGSGSGFDALKAKVGASPAAGAIDVLGFVPEADMPALFASAHVYAMPSRQEGFGIVYVEAMRFGLPVIASLGDAGQEINVDGVTGYTVAPGDVGELGEKLIHLLRNTDVAAAMGRVGFERWRTHFRYSCFAQRFLEIWREFAEGGASRRNRAGLSNDV